MAKFKWYLKPAHGLFPKGQHWTMGGYGGKTTTKSRDKHVNITGVSGYQWGTSWTGRVWECVGCFQQKVGMPLAILMEHNDQPRTNFEPTAVDRKWPKTNPHEIGLKILKHPGDFTKIEMQPTAISKIMWLQDRAQEPSCICLAPITKKLQFLECPNLTLQESTLRKRNTQTLQDRPLLPELSEFRPWTS